MDIHQSVIFIHVVFALSAFLCGFIAIIAKPKGGTLHKKAGRFYVYTYWGVIATSVLFLYYKLTFFFLALTLFNAYLITAGWYYAKTTSNMEKKNRWLLSFLWLVVIIYILDLVLMFSNLANYHYGWIIVHSTYALLAISVLVLEFKLKRKRIVLHTVSMILSYITLIDGVLARVTPIDLSWICWIIGYVIGVPLLIRWLNQSKETNTNIN